MENLELMLLYEMIMEIIEIALFMFHVNYFCSNDLNLRQTMILATHLHCIALHCIFMALGLSVLS